jgi:hypothetical protein
MLCCEQGREWWDEAESVKLTEYFTCEERIIRVGPKKSQVDLLGPVPGHRDPEPRDPGLWVWRYNDPDSSTGYGSKVWHWEPAHFLCHGCLLQPGIVKFVDRTTAAKIEEVQSINAPLWAGWGLVGWGWRITLGLLSLEVALRLARRF